ncbi:MAG: LuxR C-terminal-related transcriptional regulator [Chryseosolibacter sp.]
MIHQFSVNVPSHEAKEFSKEPSDCISAYSQLAAIMADLNQCSKTYCVVVNVIDATSLNDHKKILRQLSSLTKSLTKRELEVFELSMKGLNTKQISEQLLITAETVKTHRKRIVSKAGVTKIEEIKNWITSEQFNL